MRRRYPCKTNAHKAGEPAPPRQHDWRVALHEVSHLLVADRFGFPLVLTSIDAELCRVDPDFPTCGSGCTYLRAARRDEGTPAGRAKFAATLVAGAVGELLAQERGELNAPHDGDVALGCGTDLKQATEILRPLAKGDAGLNALLFVVMARARQILDASWTTLVKPLAKALLVRRTLTAYEVSEFLGRKRSGRRPPLR